MPYLFWTILVAVALSGAFPAEAEEWSNSGLGEYPPQSQQNRIIKWCSKDGKSTRYASANLKIKGYRPCGKLEVQETCDASGNRLLSKSTERPPGHLDCSVGPRILIVNHGNDGSALAENSYAETDEFGNPVVEPMSNRETEDLKREYELAKTMQAKDLGMQLQLVADTILKSLLSSSQSQKNQGMFATGDKKRTSAAQAKKELKQLLDHVDPQTRKILEELITKK